MLKVRARVVLIGARETVFIAACVVAGAMAAFASPGQGQLFAPPVNYSAGLYPAAVTVADFNGDGKLDIAVINASSQTVSILLGQGDGTLHPATATLPTGIYPSRIVAADFNGDGRIDLAVSNIGSNTVGIYLGNGDGTFRAPTTVVAGVTPGAIAVADLNRDGKSDLVVTSVSSGSVVGRTVTVLLGNGDGTFASTGAYTTGTNPQGIVIGDFNGDGKLDLVVANCDDSTMSILLGNGDGTFAPRVNFATGFRPGIVSAVDLNSDGKLDLAVVNSFGISIHLGRGDGTFATVSNVPLSFAPSGLAIGDFNGDGIPDLATGNVFASTLGVLAGNGAGGFQVAAMYSAGSGPIAMASASLRGNGVLDLVVADRVSNVVSVLVNSSAASPPATLTVKAGSPQSAVIGTNYATPLAVTVRDASNRTQTGIGVAFTTPATGASGSFAGGQSTARVLTDAFGVATAPVLTANATGGSFSVTAATSALSATFALTNLAGNESPSFTSSPPPGGQWGTPYTYTVRAMGTPAPTYVVANGALPTGLSLASSSGTISGTPSAVGVFGGVISAGNGVNPPAMQTFSIAVEQASQSITFAALSDTAAATPPFTVIATASSGLAVAFSSLTPAACTLSGSTVMLVAGGTCTIRASQAGNATWARAPDVDRSFSVIGPSVQTISFAALANRPLGSPPSTVNATASSGLAVSLVSLTSSTCTMNGFTVTAVGVGTCTIRASQAGNLAFTPAANVDQSFIITPGGQTISFFPLANRLLDVAPFELHATASSGLPVSFASATPTVCRVNENWVMLLIAGTCTVHASQAGNGSYASAADVDQSFAVTPANQWVLFQQPGPQTLAHPRFLASATASSGLPVTYASLAPAVCTVEGNVVTLVTVGSCTISAVQAGDANYLPASQNRSFAVTVATVALPSAGAIPGPFIEYSTLLGGYRSDGFAADTAFDVAVGPDGSAWVGGSVAGTYFPGLSSATFSNGGLDLLYVAKLNPNRGQVDVATIVGARSFNMTGSGASALANVEAMAIDTSGNVYAAAYATDRAYPLTGGVYARTGPMTIFRIAADASVQRLGVTIDPAVQTIRALAIDTAGGVYFTGVAAAGMVTTVNAVIPASSAPAGGPYLIKLAPGGGSVAYSTYLSVQGSRPSIALDPQQSPIDTRTTAYALAVDAIGNAYLAGQAQASDFPVTPDAPDTSDHQNRDAFVAKVNPDGSALLWVARIGGPDAERATSIALSPEGSIVVGGKSATLPRSGFYGAAAFQLDFEYDAMFVEREHGFVAKLRADGRDWVFVAPIGSEGGNLVYRPFSTPGDPSPTKVAVDSSGAIYVAGNASLDRRLPVAAMDELGNFRTVQSPAYYADGTLSLPYVTDPELYGTGAFLMKLTPDGDRLVYSVIVNGGRATGLTIDDFGAAYVVGYQAGLPQVNAAQAAPGSVFVTKIISQPMPVILTTTQNPAAAGDRITLTAKMGDARYTGSIEFRNDAQLLATVPVAGGAAMFSTGFAVGIHRLTAVFRGSGPFEGAAAPEVLQIVNQPSAGP